MSMNQLIAKMKVNILLPKRSESEPMNYIMVEFKAG